MIISHATINGVDFGQFGIRFEEIDGLGLLPDREWPIRPLPGRGQALLTDTPTPQSRRIVLKGTMMAATPEDLETLRGQAIWYLKNPGDGIRLASRAGKHLRCEVVGADLPPIGPWAAATSSRVTIEVLAENSSWYDDVETVVDFSAAATPCPIGNGVSRPRIRITGPVVDPVITLYAADGTPRRVTTITATLLAAEWLEIDTDAMTVTDNTGADRMEVLGEGLWIELVPGDAAGPSGPWPELEIEPAPGAGGSAVATYAQAND
ncbi:MAG TPA: hypothetical protein VFR37_05020 [Longimicrobium sp.]|nr:hypothetical protein [Longimicrobium sp.]